VHHLGALTFVLGVHDDFARTLCSYLLSLATIDRMHKLAISLRERAEKSIAETFISNAGPAPNEGLEGS
jgi:hypothetical protein